MTQNRELLVDYEEFDNPQKVCLGDGRTVEAFAKGNIHFTMVFRMSKPKKITMHNVLYVPKLACNLFSVRAAAAKGNTVKFGNMSCWIRDRNRKPLGMGSLADKLYYFDCENITQEHVAAASRSRIRNKADLWHQQLGHLNQHQLKEIVSWELVKGVEIPKSMGISFCEKCVEGNMSRKTFKSVGENRSTRRLQCVHSDVFGPMPTGSIGGRRYLLLSSMITQDVVSCTS